MPVRIVRSRWAPSSGEPYRRVGVPVAASEADSPGAFAGQEIAFGLGLFQPGEVGELLAGGVVLLDRLGIDRVHVAGHSSGTRVAARRAQDRPDRSPRP
ncbi:hypothetical protein [Streptomyces sp. NPDC059566]|uniref:hypothetical protein n=1 Tax=Streptomyces sp. NPDC059566 TaxID=3346866 RepID=UPI0036C60AB0